MNILNKLTIKHLKMNKKRTIVSIIGVILSTALMVGIGLIFSTLRENTMQSIIDRNGSHHVIIELYNDKLDTIKNNNKIRTYDIISLIGYSYHEKLVDTVNPYIEIVSAGSNYLNNLKLKKGRLPVNDKEIVIPNHLLNSSDVNFKIGDIIKLEVGNRYYEDNLLKFNDNYVDGEILLDTKKIEYTIVGIIERDVTEGYEDPGYISFTKEDDFENKYLKALITYKNPKDTYKLTPKLANILGYKNNCERISNFCYDEINYNDGLLSLYGTSQYGNVIEGMSLVIIIVLSLISIACIIVIYNSFAISVMERKKQFGLFSSIGATRKQLSKTVFFEAFIIALIGIPIGILSGIIGIGVLTIIINNLLSNFITYPLVLSFYPIFIIIPIIFMVITIFISAYIPSRMASRVSPIISIRQNDDIKIKNNKLKTPRFIQKIFGIEGEIALKNMKRNKKKYRITIISLFISIVLFISFSAISNYGINSAYNFTEIPEYDIQINAYSNNNKENYFNIMSSILNDKNIKYQTSTKSFYAYTDVLDKSYYNKEYLNMNGDVSGEYLDYGYMGISVIGLDEESYNSYLKQLNLKVRKNIIVNTGSYISYEDGNRKYITYTPYSKKDISINLYNLSFNYDSNNPSKVLFGDKIDNLYYADTLPKFIDESSSLTHMCIIMPIDELDKYSNYVNFYYRTFLDVSDYTDLWPNLEKIVDDYEQNDNINIYANNILEELKMVSNIILVIKILLYGFIALVTLIGVTSVFNTINTSINLRRKEFSMFRSMGLTPKGFNKILFFESLFFGLKSLIYGIPASIVVIMLLHYAFGTIVEFKTMLIPLESILIAIIGVFIIVIISMMYASSKIKSENILDAIREENI